MPSWTRSIGIAAVAALAACALPAPAGARAASVANGDFESGNLSGWQVYNSNSAGSTSWFAYSGPISPKLAKPIFAPPSGSWAALSDGKSVDTTILYQDVALEPSVAQTLSMTLYYFSYDPIVVPEPNTLKTDPGPFSIGQEVPKNQQMRVDVMRPSAAVESLDPGDILATVFASENGDQEQMPPTHFTTELTPFAGQTVRLRVAVAIQDNYFNGGVDAVSIDASSPPLVSPSNEFKRGKLNLNREKGTGTLAIDVPGSGTLTVVGKGKPKRIKRTTQSVPAGGTVKIPLKPTAAGRKALKAKGKLKTRIEVTFTPTGGTAATQTYKVTLKKNQPERRPRGL
jgi:hypothetical protein